MRAISTAVRSPAGPEGRLLRRLTRPRRRSSRRGRSSPSSLSSCSCCSPAPRWGLLQAGRSPRRPPGCGDPPAVPSRDARVDDTDRARRGCAAPSSLPSATRAARRRDMTRYRRPRSTACACRPSARRLIHIPQQPVKPEAGAHKRSAARIASPSPSRVRRPGNPRRSGAARRRPADTASRRRSGTDPPPENRHGSSSAQTGGRAHTTETLPMDDPRASTRHGRADARFPGAKAGVSARVAPALGAPPQRARRQRCVG